MPPELPVPLTSSKIPSSMRDPVSISAVAIMVSEPPASMLRAAPKNRFGFWSAFASTPPDRILPRSEEHTSELQSRLHLVCRLLLEKKKKKASRDEVLRGVSRRH